MNANLLRREPPAARLEPLTVSATEAARLIGISERTLLSDSWKDVPRLRRGNRTLFPVDLLRQWLADETMRQMKVAAKSNVTD